MEIAVVAMLVQQPQIIGVADRAIGQHDICGVADRGDVDLDLFAQEQRDNQCNLDLAQRAV